MSTILEQLDKEMKKNLDNRMVSYKNKTFDAFVYIGNFWLKNSDKAHKDIKDASAVRVALSDLVH